MPTHLDQVAIWATVLLLAVASALSAVVEVMLTPLYVGATIAPVTLLFAAVGNVFFTQTAWRVTRSIGAAGLPLVAWAGVVLAASVSRSEGDVLLPGGSDGWVSWMLIVVGLGCGLTTVLRRSVADPR